MLTPKRLPPADNLNTSCHLHHHGPNPITHASAPQRPLNPTLNPTDVGGDSYAGRRVGPGLPTVHHPQGTACLPFRLGLSCTHTTPARIMHAVPTRVVTPRTLTDVWHARGVHHYRTQNQNQCRHAAPPLCRSQLETSLGYFLPLPVVLAAMRGGGRAGWRTMSATCFLLVGERDGDGRP